MIMLTEKDYCDYDTCVALKELGYNQYTSLRSYAGKGGVRLWDFDGEPDYKEGELIALSDMFDIPSDGNEVAAPSLYEAQKWLRENKQIDISITLYIEGYAATIKHFYVFEGEFAWKEPIILQCCKFQEEALLNGIKEVIKLLKE